MNKLPKYLKNIIISQKILEKNVVMPTTLSVWIRNKKIVANPFVEGYYFSAFYSETVTYFTLN